MNKPISMDDPSSIEIGRMPGHLARRFQQIAVATFLAECSAAGYDLTPVQFAALAAIARTPGLDQATLAGIIAYDRATITGVLDRLTQKGLIARVRSSADRRAHVLSVTKAGEVALAGIRPAVEAAQRAMLRGLSSEEASQLILLLDKAISAANDLSRAPQKPAVAGR
ncbi:MarR Transcriptional regulators [Rhabdaerophilaceae bacterium]